jgi:anti-sigma B factor antagonist
MRGNGTFAAGTTGSQSAELSDMRAPAQADGATPGRIRFAISERQLDERTSVLGVEGELDLASAPQLKFALADMLDAGASQLVLDLSLVTFIDSTALGVLVGTHRSLAAGERLGIACSHPDVLNIFELTGLDATFDIFSTFDDALAYARGGAVAAD